MSGDQVCDLLSNLRHKKLLQRFYLIVFTIKTSYLDYKLYMEGLLIIDCVLFCFSMTYT